MARHFTLREAQRLLPEVEAGLRRARSRKSELDSVEAEIRNFVRRVQMLGGSRIDPGRVQTLRDRRDLAESRLHEAVEQVEDLGCQIKSVDTGLIDFPTYFRGEEVLMCWKLGEDRIRFWHGVIEGFRGRKKIDQDFLDNHAGDRPN